MKTARKSFPRGRCKGIFKIRRRTMYRFRKGYYADVRTERRCTSAVIYKNGVLAENKERVTDGAFIRVFDGKMWYYASTETLSNV